jgi:hypothetical protein
MERVLITVEPRMYRQAIALALQRARPHSELLYGDPLFLERLPHRLAPGVDAHLDVDVGQMALDGGLRKMKRGGYHIVGEATGDEDQ